MWSRKQENYYANDQLKPEINEWDWDNQQENYHIQQQENYDENYHIHQQCAYEQKQCVDIPPVIQCSQPDYHYYINIKNNIVINNETIIKTSNNENDCKKVPDDIPKCKLIIHKT